MVKCRVSNKMRQNCPIGLHPNRNRTIVLVYLTATSQTLARRDLPSESRAVEGPRRVLTRNQLILARSFHVIYDQVFGGTPGRFQFQPKLLLYRGRERRPARISRGGRRAGIVGRPDACRFRVPTPTQMYIERAGEFGLVDHRPLQGCRKPPGQTPISDTRRIRHAHSPPVQSRQPVAVPTVTFIRRSYYWARNSRAAF